MRLLLVIITFIWLMCGIAYLFYDFKMTSIAIAATGLIAFLTAFINYRSQKAPQTNNDKDRKKLKQLQKIGSNSTGIQIGGNFTINEKDKK